MVKICKNCKKHNSVNTKTGRWVCEWCSAEWNADGTPYEPPPDEMAQPERVTIAMSRTPKDLEIWESRLVNSLVDAGNVSMRIGEQAGMFDNDTDALSFAELFCLMQSALGMAYIHTLQQNEDRVPSADIPEFTAMEAAFAEVLWTILLIGRASNLNLAGALVAKFRSLQAKHKEQNDLQKRSDSDISGAS